MTIVALYKTFRGKEFLVPSIQSIYNHCDYLVFVSSEIGWDGEAGNNTLEVVSAFPDPLNKIRIIKHDTTSQKEQYSKGMEYIKKEAEEKHMLNG